jgi:beta-galactosidase
LARGTLPLDEIGPRQHVVVSNPFDPGSADEADRTTGDLTLTVEFRARRATSWAPRGWSAARTQLLLGRGRRASVTRPARSARHTAPITITDDGLTVREGLAIGFPTLSLFRAPTDNDAPPGNSPTTAANRWRAMGLDRLDVEDQQVQRTNTGLTRTTTYFAAAGCIVHTQRLRSTGDQVEVSAEVTLPDTCLDVPRVGAAFTLPGDASGPFDDLSWFGFGPGDSYPDRRAAVRLGRWETSVRDQAVPFVVPQEFGLHLDTRWFTIGNGTMAITVTPSTPMAFSALPWSTDDLAAATHPHHLPDRTDTFVHLDVAHRGLGTAACGPDTAERWRITPGPFRWRFTVSAAHLDAPPRARR